MLAYVLAIAVGCGGFALYMAAFFFPEVHRKYDFVWSGVAMFYALVLWVCAGRITGGVLLGQFASVALLGWFSWQTLSLRRELTPSTLQTQADAQIWRSLLKKLQQPQTSPQRVGEPVVERLTELLTNTKALVRGIWETSRRSLPTVSTAKPSRPTLVRSPSAKKDRVSRTTPTEERKEKIEAEAEQTNLVSLENAVEGAIGNPNLANPNDALELWEDDFEEDASTPPEAIALDRIVDDGVELEGDGLPNKGSDPADGLVEPVVDDAIAADSTTPTEPTVSAELIATESTAAIDPEIVTEALTVSEIDETSVSSEVKEPPEQ